MDKQIRLQEGWSTVIILVAMMFVSGLAITRADLIGGLHVVPLIAVLGVLAGLALAKSRFSPLAAHLTAVIYGIFIVYVMIGSLDAYFFEATPWRERILDLTNRQMAWLEKAFRGGTSRDGLIFVIQTSAIYWLLGYSAAWFTFRVPRLWRAVVPTFLILLSVVYYYTGPDPLWFYLLGYLLLALLYVVRTHLIDQEARWRSAYVRYEPGIWFPFLRAGLIAALLLMLVSWNLPALSASTSVNDALTGTRGPWRDFQDNWTRLFSALRSYSGPVADPYSETLVLGGPRNVGSTPVMDVYVPEKLSNVYWQAIIHDTYEDGRWDVASSDEMVLVIPEAGPLDTPTAVSRQVVTQTVINYLPNSSLLYGAPELLETDIEMFVEGDTNPEGDLLVTAVRSRYVLRQGDEYRVFSSVPVADEVSLRRAAIVYPDWVSERYLQLPESITPETLTLAEDLTVSADNPYDAAVAVRDYLRHEIAYNDQIAAPPEGVDPVHHTLFVSQEGYCTYYASAMAVMLRSQGIPSRLVSGYAQGEFDPASSSYRVRASNAHTWVEVYFPSYGWIQFEPTASLPIETRPEAGPDSLGDASNAPAFESPADFEELGLEEQVEELNPDDLADLRGAPEVEPANAAGNGRSFPIWQALGALLVLGIAGGTFYGVNEYNRRVEGDVQRSYGRLGNWARWLGVVLKPSQTPYERADRITDALPAGREPIQTLTDTYVERQFSGNGRAEDGDLQQQWQVLRPLFRREAIRRRLNRLRFWDKEDEIEKRWREMQRRL